MFSAVAWARPIPRTRWSESDREVGGTRRYYLPPSAKATARGLRDRIGDVLLGKAMVIVLALMVAAWALGGFLRNRKR